MNPVALPGGGAITPPTQPHWTKLCQGQTDRGGRWRELVPFEAGQMAVPIQGLGRRTIGGRGASRLLGAFFATFSHYGVLIPSNARWGEERSCTVVTHGP